MWLMAPTETSRGGSPVFEQTRRQHQSSRFSTRSVQAPAAVLAGGVVGSALRAAISEIFPVTDGRFPTTTLLVNLSGALLLGFYLARRQRAITARWSLQFWAIGGLGSFTTFSAFSFEVSRLVATGEGPIAIGYVLASLVGGLAAALLGQRLGRVVR